MATLRNQCSEPLLDGDKKEGSVVVDDMFGEGIARGTVPLEHGDGVNVLIDFLGPAQDPKPPASRGAENLKRAPAGRTRTTSFTTGTDFESGAAHRARGGNSHERHASTPQKRSTTVSYETAPRDQPSCKSTTVAVGHLDSSYRGLSRRERCGASACIRYLAPCRRRLNYNTAVITATVL